MHFDDQFPLKTYIQGRDSLSRQQANLFTQIHTGHILLNKYLYRIKRKDSPNCEACLGVGIEALETPRHLLYECPSYDRERFLSREVWAGRPVGNVMGLETRAGRGHGYVQARVQVGIQ